MRPVPPPPDNQEEGGEVRATEGVARTPSSDHPPRKAPEKRFVSSCDKPTGRERHAGRAHSGPGTPSSRLIQNMLPLLGSPGPGTRAHSASLSGQCPVAARAAMAAPGVQQTVTSLPRSRDDWRPRTLSAAPSRGSSAFRGAATTSVTTPAPPPAFPPVRIHPLLAFKQAMQPAHARSAHPGLPSPTRAPTDSVAPENRRCGDWPAAWHSGPAAPLRATCFWDTAPPPAPGAARLGSLRGNPAPQREVRLASPRQPPKGAERAPACGSGSSVPTGLPVLSQLGPGSCGHPEQSRLPPAKVDFLPPSPAGTVLAGGPRGTATPSRTCTLCPQGGLPVTKPPAVHSQQETRSRRPGGPSAPCPGTRCRRTRPAVPGAPPGATHRRAGQQDSTHVPVTI